MFEFLFARKYLLPSKRALSVSLIASMSVIVISLVVWLVLLFLSITEGIERNWLTRLTALNGPIRITPTKEYFQSHYHLVDSLAYESGYSLKTIGEKLRSPHSDPYDPDVDSSLPAHWPTPLLNERGELKDLVKELFALLPEKTIAQDYQFTGALLRLKMVRPEIGSPSQERQNFLTQVSYIASYSDKSPHLSHLILPPTPHELTHLFYMAEVGDQELTSDQVQASSKASAGEFQENMARLLPYVTLSKMQPSYDFWRIPHGLMPQEGHFSAQAKKGPLGLSYIVLSDEKSSDDSLIQGRLEIKANRMLFISNEGSIPVALNTPLLFGKAPLMDVTLIPESVEKARALSDLLFEARFNYEGQLFSGLIAWRDLEIVDAKIETHVKSVPAIAPPWALFNEESQSYQLGRDDQVLLPKSYQDSGVQIGDKGYLSFGAMATSTFQEQRLPIQVAGFYDPGVMSMGAKYILAAHNLVRDIASANQSFTFDPELSSGVQVWIPRIEETASVVSELKTLLSEKGLSPYWKITPFYEYEFAKDLLQQFKSDRTLFTLIGIIILVVACTNIISLLVLLVNDKRMEIGILQAMGASTKSIGLIFALCGVFMGVLGSLIGSALAFITLKNIDSLVQFLSFFQGHELLNAAFYGKSLPSELSGSALAFILISTPLLSLLAGIVPALKACRLKPTEILRS